MAKSPEPKATSVKPSAAAETPPIPAWMASPDRFMENVYRTWQEMARPFLPPLAGTGPDAAWRAEADRYFKDFNKRWLDVARASSLNMFQPFTPLSNGAPALIADKDDRYEVTAPLPGLEAADVSVEVDGGFLTIEGEKSTEGGADDDNPAMRYWMSGAYHQMVRLPGDADVENVSAKLEKGVLTVTVPKATDKAAPRQIDVDG